MPPLLGQLKRTTWRIAPPSQKLLALVVALVLALSAFGFVSREAHAQAFEEQQQQPAAVLAGGVPNIDGIGGAAATVPISGTLPTQPTTTEKASLVVKPPTEVPLTSVTPSLIGTPSKETPERTERLPSKHRRTPPTVMPPTTEQAPTTETSPSSENAPQIARGTPPQTTGGRPPSIETSPLVEMPPMGTTISGGMPPLETASPIFGPTPENAPEVAGQNDSQLRPGQPYGGYESSAAPRVQGHSPVLPLGIAYQYGPRTLDVSPAFDQTMSVDSWLGPAPAPDSYQTAVDLGLVPTSQLDRLPMLLPASHRDWQPNVRGGSSILNKPPLVVDACDLCAKLLRAIDSNPTVPHPSLVSESGAKLFSSKENGSLPVLQGGKPPLPLQTGGRSAPLLGDGQSNAVPTEPLSYGAGQDYGADQEPLASVTTVPGLSKGALRSLALFEAMISEAVGTVLSADTSLDANLAGLLPDRSAEHSSVTTTEDAGGTPPQQPRFPSPPAPVEDSSFSLSGGGQIGAGSAVPLLFLGALALSLFSLRRDGRLSKAFCEVQRLCSVLLLPLERPG